MTRLLSKQLNDSQTTYRRLNYTADQKTLFTDITASTINAAAVSDIQGGSEDSIGPRIISTNIEPFVFSSGTIGIRRNGGSTVSVALLATDDTASKILQKINTAMGATIAFWFEGRLMLKSTNIVGSAGTLELSNISGNILAAIGLPPGITTGIDAGTRGVMTNSTSDYGGRVLLSQIGHQVIVTDAVDFTQLNDATGSPIQDVSYSPRIIGGSPIFGYLSPNGSNYRIRYFTELPPNAEVHTVAGDFTAIDASDTLNFSIRQSNITRSFSFSFLAGPNTRDTVIDRINERWGDLIGVPNARVIVRGTVSQPFNFADADDILVSVGGAPETNVSLTGSHRTVADVATALSAVPGLVATAVTNATGSIVLELTTSSGVGFKSSITLRERNEPNGGFSPNGLAKLGLSAGTYIGPHIAKYRGAFEITLFAHSRGAQSRIAVDTNGSSVTAARMGLSLTQDVSGSNDPVDVEVALPENTYYGQDENAAGADPSGIIRINAIFPEVLSFGELPPDHLTIPQEFASQVSTSNLDPRKDFVQIEDGSSYPNSFSNLLKFGGQPVTARPDGQVDIGQLRKSTDFFMRYMKQFLDANFNTGAITSVLTSQISTPGFNGNAVATSPTLNVLIDPTAAHPIDDRGFNIRFAGSSSSEYSFKEGLGIIKRTVELGQDLASSLSDSSVTPRIIHRVNDSSERQLMWFFRSGTAARGKIRLYVNANTSGRTSFELVINASWDGTNWTKDSNTNPSIRMVLANEGVNGLRMDVEESTSVFADSAWVNSFRFPTLPVEGIENQFAKLLRLGQAFITSDTDTDAETPRIISEQHAPDPSIDRTLMWHIPTAGGTRGGIRIYATTNSINQATGGTGFEVTYNCSWDNSTGRWTNDVTNAVCSKFYIGENGFALKTTDTFTSITTFDDIDSSAGWQKAGNPGKAWTSLLWRAISSGTPSVEFNFDGPILFSNESLNVLPSSLFRNALYANLIPKIYCRFRVNFGVIQQFEGYAAAPPSLVGDDVVFPWHFTPDQHTQVTFVIGKINMDNLITHNRVLISVRTSASDYRFRIHDSATGFVLDPNNIDISFSFAAYYTA